MKDLVLTRTGAGVRAGRALLELVRIRPRPDSRIRCFLEDTTVTGNIGPLSMTFLEIATYNLNRLPCS